MKTPELEAWMRRAETAESECRRLNPLVVRLRRERDAAVDEASRLTVPGSAEMVSKAEPKDGSAKVEEKPNDFCSCGHNRKAHNFGDFDLECSQCRCIGFRFPGSPPPPLPTPSQAPSAQPAPTPKAEPKPKRGHVCDTRCMGDSGHHSWPAPRPDECLCNQELAGRPVFCPSCANKPKPHQSVNITDMIPKPADEGKVDGPPQSPAEAAELDVKRYDMRVTYMVNVPCVTSHEVCDGAWVIYHDVEKIVRALRAENQRQAGEIEELKKQSQIIREMPSR